MRKRDRLQSTAEIFVNPGTPPRFAFVETQPRRNTTRNHVQFKSTRSCPTSTSGHEPATELMDDPDLQWDDHEAALRGLHD